MLLLDDEGVYADANESLCRYFGLTQPVSAAA
jgi:hypothetical protein